MQRIIQLIIWCLSTFLTAIGNDKPVETSNEVLKPRHDGKHFFIAPTITVAQPTQADIESAIADAQTQGRIIKITSVGFSIPAALKEITSLPVTFRNQIDGWNYDITVFAITFTPSGSKLSIGCKFNLPNNQAIYFGANDIATSGKNGFVGELPILTSTLTDAKQAELDDTGGLLGGETQFYEVSIPNFNDKLKMGLSKDTKLHFECGTFKKFTLSGYLKSFDAVERENNDGAVINDGKPLMLFFGTKDVFDWQHMYFEANVSRAFHHANLKELGFNFSASNKAIIDLSKTQNPASLPTCVNADGWQGVYFPTFQVRLPQFFKLRTGGVTLASRTGKNLFIDKTGLLGHMTAEKVYALNEGYTDEVNQFDMSLDLLSSNFVCNQAPVVTMLGRIQLGKCSSASNQGDKLLYYNVIYDKVSDGYSFLVKEKESGNYSSNSLTLETGSTVNFGISGSSLVINAKLPKTPIITTAAYNNSVCSNFETTLSLSDCSTGMFKWTTNSGDENINPLTIKPITTLTNEQIVYRANCFDKYCINENSNTITLTVYNGLPDLTLNSDKSVMCSSETATLTVGSTCAGKISWSTPENATFSIDNVNTKVVEYLSLSATQDKVYKVRCELGECYSNQTNEAVQTISIKKAPTKPILTTLNADNSANPTHTVCSGNSIIISGTCSADAGAVFAWTTGLRSTDTNPYTLITDASNPQNKDYVYQATCTKDGCSSVADLTVKESPIPKPTYFFAVRNPIEAGGLVEIAALGCPQGSYVWSNNKTGNWNGQNGETVQEILNQPTTYSVRCLVNGCSSLPIDPITVNVVSCEEAYPAPSLVGSIDGLSEVLPNSPVKLYASGCDNMYEWSNGVISTNNDGKSTIITVNLSETTEYKVRCKKDDGCKSAWKSVVTIKVKSCEEGVAAPSIIGSINNLNDVTPNTVVKLYAAGCSNQYEWSNGIVSSKNDGSSTIITVNPSETTKYKVRCKVDDGCKSGWTAEFEVRVKTCEEGVSAPSTIGSIDNLNDITPNTSVKLYAAGCSNQYEWSNGIVSSKNDGSSTIITVNPSETTKYKVRCKVDDGCKSSWTAEFEVRVKATTPCAILPAAPVISATNTSLILDTDSATLTASGCSGTITWSNSGKGNKITVSTATKYSATCSVDGCVSGKSNEVIITKDGCITPVAPVISITQTNGVLKVVGCSGGTLLWNIGIQTESITPIESGTYTATCTITNACGSHKSSTTFIFSAPSSTCSSSIPSIAASVTINLGETATITANGCSGSISWSNGETNNQISVSPTKTTLYRAVCKEGKCNASASEFINVFVRCTKPDIKVSAKEICIGDSVTLTADCSEEVIWNNNSTSKSINVSPTIKTFYSAQCKGKDCAISESSGQEITVQASQSIPLPTITIIGAMEKVDNSYGVILGNPVNVSASCPNGYELEWTEKPQSFFGGDITLTNHAKFSAKCKKGNCSSNTVTKYVQLFKLIKFRDERWWYPDNVKCDWATNNQFYTPIDCQLKDKCNNFYGGMFARLYIGLFDTTFGYWYQLHDTYTDKKYKVKIKRGNVVDIKDCD
jgi:hypothetical protein